MTVVPVCVYCKHFNAKRIDRETCTAFPDGIPSVILTGRNKHMVPMEGDHGIMFTPLPGFEYIAEEGE